MKKRVLGRSGIALPPIGLGCMEIGGRMRDREGYLRKEAGREDQQDFFLGHVDDEQSIRTLEFALDAGVCLFDTAPAYGAGHSERVLGRALRGKRHKAIVATKFGKPIDEGQNSFGSYASEKDLIASIRQECEQSLNRLETDYIDLYQYHQMSYELTDHADEVLDILESLVQEGKIRYYGWSTENPRCAEVFARGKNCTAIQHAMNVLCDTPEMLRVCAARGQASISRGIMSMGFLTGKYTLENYKELLSLDDFRLRDEQWVIDTITQLDRIREVLASGGRTIAQGSIGWNWARSELTIPIIGFRTLLQVQESVRALEYGPLSPGQMKEIDTLLGRALQGQ